MLCQFIPTVNGKLEIAIRAAVLRQELGELHIAEGHYVVHGDCRRVGFQGIHFTANSNRMTEKGRRFLWLASVLRIVFSGSGARVPTKYTELSGNAVAVQSRHCAEGSTPGLRYACDVDNQGATAQLPWAHTGDYTATSYVGRNRQIRGPPTGHPSIFAEESTGADGSIWGTVVAIFIISRTRQQTSRGP
ncbi:hypothetical protein NOR_03837 [Metarhizium rileyi]|uniref:Uncharacterized protein n=1 Tax=Metarhizium rileyi (strain RCEF 4871) TaxID=1649241 RepID=A0A167ELD0_METRR|nr:hypothetical protein NOR_03837 [Metarhizium rileyi RCEF 4871]